MAKREYHTLSRKSIEKGTYFSLLNSMRLLDDCESLLKTNSSISSILGLYIFALEEFGKCLLIKDISSTPNEEYKIPTSVFGDHKLKINRALQNMPQELNRHTRGEYTTLLNTDEGYTFFDKEKQITRLSPTLGYFLEKGSMTKPTFDVRKDCFHVDWDSVHEQWKINIDMPKRDFLN